MEFKRRIAKYRCMEFDCKKSIDRWQCCHFCESVKRCVARCKNDPKKCQLLYLDSKLIDKIDEYRKPKRGARE